MEEILKLLSYYNKESPLKFWLLSSLLVIIIWIVIYRFSEARSNAKKAEEKNRRLELERIALRDKAYQDRLNKRGNLEETVNPEVLEPKRANPTIARSNAQSQSKEANKSVEKRQVIPPVKDKKEEIEPKLKPKSIEQLPKAKIETAKAEHEIDYVNYEITLSRTVNSYPVLNFPNRGTVVRSYRLGNTKRRGFKEESFQKSIEKYFGEHFKILGNVRLNTGKETRPFEPDIAIIDSSNSNLRIDIEIDEPYAGITRQPTHCKGEDVNRDIYFVDRGWIVIRFSEYQVHLHESACLSFIAEVIKSAIPNFDLPILLRNQPKLESENLWDIVQAQKWEKAKFREEYLNHTFATILEQVETVERDFDEQELKEEKLVKRTVIGMLDKKEQTGFNSINRHPRDNRIKFYPDPHVYTIDNTPAPSASTVIAKFFPEFDSYGKAKNLSSSNPLFGLPPEDIVEIWNSRGVDAANQGSFLHEQIEKYYLGLDFEKTSEFHLFEQFCLEHKDLNPFRTEWRVFDEEHHIAGTIDLITKNRNGYELYDWKRSKKVIDTLSGSPIKTDTWGNAGVGQLSSIPDTSYNRYCLQQSLYKYILEKNYGLTISNMFLVVLYPDYDRYFKVEVPYLKDKAEYILRTL